MKFIGAFRFGKFEVLDEGVGASGVIIGAEP